MSVFAFSGLSISFNSNLYSLLLASLYFLYVHCRKLTLSSSCRS
jgi:hypothetical protein